MAIEEGRSFDLHELDAASHNKVDDIRDLISKVQLGSPGRTKVYILDEVHMLSPGAENALLKTLEEPPDHVVFVLATTEPHKVVSTIRSRTQHFEFHLLPSQQLEELVNFVVEDANLSVPDGTIDYVLQAGGGSARDTLSALDLVAATGGIPQHSDIGIQLTRAIGTSDTESALRTIQAALEAGQEPRTVGENAIQTIRNVFLIQMGAAPTQLAENQIEELNTVANEVGPATLTRSLSLLGQALIEIRQAPDPRIPLEVALVNLCRAGNDDPDALAQRIEILEKEVAALKAGLHSNQATGDRKNPMSASRNPPTATKQTQQPSTSGTPGESAKQAKSGSMATPPSPRSRRKTKPTATATGTPQPQPQIASEPSVSETAEIPAEPGGAEQPAKSEPPAKEIDLKHLNSSLDSILSQMTQGARVRFKAGSFVESERFHAPLWAAE